MENLMKIRTLLFASVILATTAACEERREALNESAEDVLDQREELSEERADLRDEDVETAGEDVAERADIAHASADLASAQVDFATQRDAMVRELRFRHGIYETQSAVARGLLADQTLTETDRQTATDRVLTLERELAEAEQAIDALATATAAQWDASNVTASNAFQQLEGAHDDAFDALSADREILRQQ